jgi:hypothetical protein
MTHPRSYSGWSIHLLACCKGINPCFSQPPADGAGVSSVWTLRWYGNLKSNACISQGSYPVGLAPLHFIQPYRNRILCLSLSLIALRFGSSVKKGGCYGGKGWGEIARDDIVGGENGRMIVRLWSVRVCLHSKPCWLSYRDFFWKRDTYFNSSLTQSNMCYYILCQYVHQLQLNSISLIVYICHLISNT